jgi:hypothetical protein
MKRMRKSTVVAAFIIYHKLFVSKYITLGHAEYNGTDVTSVIVNAINSQVDTVIIENTGRPWKVQPITIWSKNNFTLVLEPGVVIQAKSGAFTDLGDCLFQFKVCSNIRILGYGASFQMIKSEYTTGEWRHAIALYNCSHFDIKGTTRKDSGGDGLYL